MMRGEGAGSVGSFATAIATGLPMTEQNQPGYEFVQSLKKAN
jgi:hypothetical protein